MSNKIESTVEETTTINSKYPFSKIEMETVKLKYTLIDVEQIAVN